MIPSLARRLVALFGICAGCVAVFVADWPVATVPSFTWKILAALAVLALLAMRVLPRSTVDDAELRKRVGVQAVNRLVRVQAIAILCLFLVILPALLVASLLPDLGTRHLVLACCAAAVAGAMSALAFVEWRFRQLVANSGLRLRSANP